MINARITQVLDDDDDDDDDHLYMPVTFFVRELRDAASWERCSRWSLLLARNGRTFFFKSIEFHCAKIISALEIDPL